MEQVHTRAGNIDERVTPQEWVKCTCTLRRTPFALFEQARVWHALSDEEVASLTELDPEPVVFLADDRAEIWTFIRYRQVATSLLTGSDPGMFLTYGALPQPFGHSLAVTNAVFDRVLCGLLPPFVTFSVNERYGIVEYSLEHRSRFAVFGPFGTIRLRCDEERLTFMDADLPCPKDEWSTRCSPSDYIDAILGQVLTHHDIVVAVGVRMRERLSWTEPQASASTPPPMPDRSTEGWRAVFAWDERYGRQAGIPSDKELAKRLAVSHGHVRDMRVKHGYPRRTDDRT